MTPRERMASWRAFRGLTHDAAAQAVGIDQAMWTRIENGKNEPSLETAHKIELATKGTRFRIRMADWISTRRAA